jgi:deaminated glutathione amidase
MIIDPWGVILAELDGEGGEPEIATAGIDLGLVDKIRMEMPLLRRTSVPPTRLLAGTHIY